MKIKFWIKDKNKFVITNKENLSCKSLQVAANTIFPDPVLPAAGFADKNGNDVFVGDIIEVEIDETSKIDLTSCVRLANIYENFKEKRKEALKNLATYLEEQE